MSNTKNIEASTHTVTSDPEIKKIYQDLKDELQDAMDSLKSATTREMADKELRHINAMIMSVNVSNRFYAIKLYTKDLTEKVYAVMSYDVTRSELCSILNKLLEKINSVIAEARSTEG